MRGYSPTAKERAMKMRDVLLEALAGKMSWIQAAEVLGLSPRTIRRWREKFDESGIDGLYDGRRQSPSDRALPAKELQKWLRLYRVRYAGYNVRHFCSLARRQHGLTWSYTLMRNVLQGAGLVRKRRPRGKHRMRREPRPCYGEMLHIDGSRHRWLTRRPEEYQHLIVVIDDATKEILYAQMEACESTHTVMKALWAVLTRHGIPAALYSDRASWAAHTPRKGEPVDKTVFTQVGRALRRLGIEHILAYSPQARGRSERANRTLQDRLVNELRTACIATADTANRYLEEVFIPNYNAEFARTATDPVSAFVPLAGVELDPILCHEEERTVGRDNTVTLDGVRLQIAKQPGRITCAGLRVTLRRHLDGTFAIGSGTRTLGRFDRRGRAIVPPTPQEGTTCESDRLSIGALGASSEAVSTN
jgi:transposase